MSDKKPLLKTHNPLPIDTDSDNENKSFSDWRQYFKQQKTDAMNKKLNDKIKHTTKDIPISVFQLVISTIINNSICPFGIDLNPLNFDRLHKLCHYDNKTILSSLAPLTPLFHENVMHLVYWFFGISIVTFLSAFFEYICWTVAMERQTSRMSVLLFQSLIQRIIKKETKEQLSTYSKAGKIAQEVFSSLRTVLSFNGSKWQQKQYEKELKLNERCTVRKDAAFGAFSGWLFFISFVVYAIGFIFGSILMSYGNHRTPTISDILIIVNMFAIAFTLLSSIGPFFQSISEAQGAALSVFRLIDEAHDENINEREILQENISDENSISDINGDIEFDNVSFSYPSRENTTALNNLKLIARANQTTALVGSSGCGKSTCVSLLLRYYEPSSGRIIMNGQSITNYKIKQFRQNIGVVSQEPILFGISIYENIRFGKLNATRAEIEHAAEQANAHKFIMKLPKKYDTLVGERGIQLSGGEKQRIALARALVKQPNILLLDEATSALDNVSERIVQEALDRACKNRTTIVIAHRLTTIQNADYIYVLDKGGVIEEGTHE
ncbi:unnamed protein product, partial [Adineta steineri]